MVKVSMSHEDYLEAIVMLGGTAEQSVRSVDIANGDVTLTKAGYEYAQSVFKRHRYLTAFLSQAVGIPEEVAEDEACLMEHAISDESFEKWVAYIEDLGIVDPEEK